MPVFIHRMRPFWSLTAAVAETMKVTFCIGRSAVGNCAVAMD